MTLATLFVLCRFFHFAAVMQIFGISVMAGLLAPKGFATGLLNQNQRLMSLSVGIAALTAVGMLAIQAGLMGNGLEDCLNLNVWLLVLTTTFGEVWRWHLLLTAIALMVWLMDWLPGRVMLMFLTSTGLLFSQALIGHAAMNEGALGMLQRGNHTLHLLSAAYWFGSLLPLLGCLLYTERDETRPYAIATLIRFSTCGHVAVALVILTGILNSAIILQRLPTDLSSRYIQLLLVKIALVVVMTGVAIFNRYRLVPLIPTEPQLAYQRLASATKLELVLSLVVMLLVSWFATLSPF